MPNTQHDALVWLSGSTYDVLFDMARTVVHDLAGQASLGEETSSWPYRHDRDLTGFVDGSENPTLLDAPDAALLPEGVPGAAGSVLLLQKWKHRTAEWEALPVEQQERIMGRTKPDSIELENKPSDSHVARTDQDDFGNIFRRNMPYGNIEDHGTMFVGFSADQKRLSRMLDSMAGLVNGTRDAIDRLVFFRAFRGESAALAGRGNQHRGLRVASLRYIGSSSPACSRTMYSAYQSGQFGSALPMRFSCSP
jgi:putative iron-dependent peroxidase